MNLKHIVTLTLSPSGFWWRGSCEWCEELLSPTHYPAAVKWRREHIAQHRAKVVRPLSPQPTRANRLRALERENAQLRTQLNIALGVQR